MFLPLVCLSAMCQHVQNSTGIPALNSYDVIWRSPSMDAAGSMPIGNGQVVLNVWVEKSTGDLLFYIGRTDSLSEISRYLKLGLVRIHLDGVSLQDDKEFVQHLNLQDGRIEILGTGFQLSLVVDSDSDNVLVIGKSDKEVTAKVTLESWRTEARPLPAAEKVSAWSVHDAPFPLIESADHFIESTANRVTWYHRNETTVVPQVLENQSLTGLKGAFDPLLHRTFGGQILANGFQSVGPNSLSQAVPSKTFRIQIATYTKQTPTQDEWLHGLKQVVAKGQSTALESRTQAWWHRFWNRSWLLIDAPAEKSVGHSIGLGYNLQRYVQACQGRGEYPIKFNGGYYTVDPKAMGKPFNADFRNWGDSHWFQNVRHMYHPMLAMGDFEMMEPFFKLYENARPLAESRTAKYHAAKGAYFPETMTVFGTYSGGDYGWDRTNHEPKDVDCKYWQYAWNQGPELLGLMLDRWDYTGDKQFLTKRLLPMAKSVLDYFDTRFNKDESGRILLDPTQVVETYWYGVKNDMPTTAGLISVTHRLCSLPEDLVPADLRSYFERIRNACPQLPLDRVDGKTALAPAQKYDPEVSNVENGELYGVWPFRLSSLAHPDLLEAGRVAYAVRKNHLDTGWGYDGNVAALLGLTDEAARILKVKCENSHKGYRWPATWGPNYDWLPDQNHGGNLLNTANLMLMQAEPLADGGAIRLLPSWPKNWNVDFKLKAPGGTTVHCIAVAGEIVKLEVKPESRRVDVVLGAGWNLKNK